MQLKIPVIKQFLDASLKEDLGIGGDLTSLALINDDTRVVFAINTRQDITICGLPIAEYFLQNYSNATYQIHYSDGQSATAGTALIEGIGAAREILTIERVLLNYLQHLSGIATLTNKYVQTLRDTNVKLYDTRKTLPNWRILQKYAVKCGGGHNHRLALDSSILIKDNHIALCGGVAEAIKRAKQAAPHYTKIEIECDNLEQVEIALANSADIIMLDNMNPEMLLQAVKMINKRAIVEASGCVDLNNIYEIAKTGVDLISVGKLTHSAPAVDLGLDIMVR